MNRKNVGENIIVGILKKFITRNVFGIFALYAMQIYSGGASLAKADMMVEELARAISDFISACNNEQTEVKKAPSQNGSSKNISRVLEELPKSIIFFATNFQDKFSCCFLPESCHAGQLPIAVCDIIEHLKRAVNDPEPYQNAFLFYGPLGTGKTTLVEEVGKLTGAKVFVLGVPTTVNEATAAVKEIFDKADKYLGVYEEPDSEKINEEIGSEETAKRQSEFQKKKERTAIIFVDNYDYRNERNTNLALYVCIKEHSMQPRLVIIIASNKIEALNSALLEHVELVKFSLPDQAGCRAILEKYLSQRKHDLSESSINDFARQAYEAGLSPRNIETMVADAEWECEKRGLDTITEKFMKRAVEEQVRENTGRNEVRRKQEAKGI